MKQTFTIIKLLNLSFESNSDIDVEKAFLYSEMMKNLSYRIILSLINLMIDGNQNVR